MGRHLISIELCRETAEHLRHRMGRHHKMPEPEAVAELVAAIRDALILDDTEETNEVE